MAYQIAQFAGRAGWRLQHSIERLAHIARNAERQSCDHSAGREQFGHEFSSGLVATGLPLGLFSHATCDSPTIGIEKGAALLLVSRGVVEGKCKDNSKEDLEFGLEGVKQHMRDTPPGTARELSASVLNAVGDFTCAPLIVDDMTALAFIRTA